MWANESTTNSLLIIGGDSSLASPLFKLAKDSSYSIYATSRRARKYNHADPISWFTLDLESSSSIIEFLEIFREIQLQRIICLVGGTFVNTSTDRGLDELQEYYKIFTSNLFYVLEELSKNLQNNSNIIVMSSRAANSKSFDMHYAATKGATESFVNSYSRFLDSEKSIVAVRCGLILNSRMFFDMDRKIREHHLKLSNQSLLSLEEAAGCIWQLSPNVTASHNGEVINIGVEY